MKNIRELVKRKAAPKSRARNAREDLIEQIVAQTDGKKADQLRRLLALAGNTLKWTETDFTTLLRKKRDPKVRNYTALVWWHTKIAEKREKFTHND